LFVAVLLHGELKTPLNEVNEEINDKKKAQFIKN
jgi:hypothetical protein